MILYGDCIFGRGYPPTQDEAVELMQKKPSYQPKIHRALKKLEAFGLVTWQRYNTRGVKLTTHGAEMYRLLKGHPA